MEKIKKWIPEHKTEFLILIIILLIASYFRLYRISEYMTFLGDEGRDVIVVRRLLVEQDPILIGPGTSIGNMYLGPLYYYLMAPALLLSGLSPVGPAVMIALLGIVTVILVWFVSRQWFPNKSSIHWGALVAALLYAISPVVITYSKSSWNPNIMPFFALLSMYAVWRVWKFMDYKWLIVIGVSMAFVLNSHYLGLLLFPTLAFFWLLTFLKVRKYKTQKKFFLYSIIAFVVFAFLMSPLFIFDARHEWRNFSAIKTFFTERQTTVSVKPWSSLPKLFPIWKDNFVTRIVAANNHAVGLWVAFGIMDVTILYIFYFRKRIKEILFSKDSEAKEQFADGFLLVVVWLLVGIVGMGLYKQHIYDHYFGFLFPAVFILFGAIIQKILDGKSRIFTALLVVGILIVVFVNLKNSPLRYPPNRQLQRSTEVSSKIVEESGGHKLNLAVIAERNYEGAYQYFLEWWKVPFVMIDPQRVEETVAEQLFVVCELPKDTCDPVNNPKSEIANFGWSKVEDQWDIAGVTLYKLVHTNKI